MNQLVAAFLGYEAKAHRPSDDDSSDDGMGWTQAAAAVPGPEAARTATTREEAIAAFERHFFGEIKDVSQL